jgi:hypothetical protein
MITAMVKKATSMEEKGINIIMKSPMTTKLIKRARAGISKFH